MSRDNNDDEVLDADALDEASLEADLESMEESLVSEDLDVKGLDVDSLEDDLDSDEDGLDEDDVGDDGQSSSREVPAGVRPTDEDDDEDEELEADLGEILKERLASEDDDEDDEDDEIGIVTGSRSGLKQEDEILCEGCFLLVKPSQFDTRSPEPSCPHCGTPIL